MPGFYPPRPPYKIGDQAFLIAACGVRASADAIIAWCIAAGGVHTLAGGFRLLAEHEPDIAVGICTHIADLAVSGALAEGEGSLLFSMLAGKSAGFEG